MKYYYLLLLRHVSTIILSKMVHHFEYAFGRSLSRCPTGAIYMENARNHSHPFSLEDRVWHMEENMQRVTEVLMRLSNRMDSMKEARGHFDL